MAQALLTSLMPLTAAEGPHLAAWEIGIVAFLFVGYILLVAAVLERWEERIHA